MKKKLCYFGKKMQFCLTQSIRKHEGDIFNRYSPLGNLLFLRNGFRNLCITFFKKYLYIIQEFFLKIARNYIWAKQNQTTFYLIKMAGKLFNLNLVSIKDYFY